MTKSPKESWEFSGHPGMSYQTCPTRSSGNTRDDYQSPKSGPKVPRSPGTTRDIPGCPTRDIPECILGQLGTSWDVLPDMTTKVPCPKVPRSPEILGTSRDVLPDHDYQSPRSKSPKKSWDNLGHPGMSYQIMTTKVPCPKVPRSPGTTWDIPGCPTRL